MDWGCLGETQNDVMHSGSRCAEMSWIPVPGAKHKMMSWIPVPGARKDVMDSGSRGEARNDVMDSGSQCAKRCHGFRFPGRNAK